MKRLSEIVGIEYSWRSIGLNFALVAALLTGGYLIFSPGSTDSHIVGYGKKVEGYGKPKIKKDDSQEKIVDRSGLFIKGQQYLPGMSGYEYTGNLGNVPFEFKIDTDKRLTDVSLLVDGVEQKVTYAKVKDGKGYAGNANFRDFTEKGGYEVSLVVMYEDGNVQRTDVALTRKENTNKKNRTQKVRP
jgi:hypothetical protein